MDNMIMKDLDNYKTFDDQLVNGLQNIAKQSFVTGAFDFSDTMPEIKACDRDIAYADRDIAYAYNRVDRSAEVLEAMLIGKEQELEDERKTNDLLVKQIEYCKKNGIWAEEKA